MLSRLLRRLQGRPVDGSMSDADAPGSLGAPTSALPATEDADAGFDAAPGVSTAALQWRFLADLLDAPPAVPTPGVAADVLARLDVMATHLDVARLPRLPAVVPQLLAALRRNESDAAALATLLARDSTLSGDVLRIANSAHYRRGRRVSALPQAVSAIGADGLRYAVLTSVTRPILQSDPARQGARLGEALSQHCEARTWLCGTLAGGTCDPAEAQLASVIAATGTAALLRMLPHAMFVQASADADFAPAFFALANGLSARAATHWHLHEATCRAIAGIGAAEAPAGSLADVLARADRIAMLRALGAASGIATGPSAHDIDDALPLPASAAV